MGGARLPRRGSGILSGRGLRDRWRSGRPAHFTPVQVAVVKALACQLPARSGVEQRYNPTARPFSWKFTSADLEDLMARIERHDQREATQQHEHHQPAVPEAA